MSGGRAQYSYNVTGLTPTLTYSYLVSAVNDVNAACAFGQPSACVFSNATVATQTPSVPSQVQSLAVSAVTSNSALVSWLPGLSNGMSLTNYTGYVQLIGAGGVVISTGSSFINPPTLAGQSYSLSDLSPGLQYIIYVQARHSTMIIILFFFYSCVRIM